MLGYLNKYIYIYTVPERLVKKNIYIYIHSLKFWDIYIYIYLNNIYIYTLPETKSSPPKKWHFAPRKQSYSNHPFSGALAVSFREGITNFSGCFPPSPVG